MEGDQLQHSFDLLGSGSWRRFGWSEVNSGNAEPQLGASGKESVKLKPVGDRLEYPQADGLWQRERNAELGLGVPRWRISSAYKFSLEYQI